MGEFDEKKNKKPIGDPKPVTDAPAGDPPPKGPEPGDPPPQPRE